MSTVALLAQLGKPFHPLLQLALEAWTLVERGDVGHAAFYVFASVGAALAGLIFGVHLMRWVLA